MTQEITGGSTAETNGPMLAKSNKSEPKTVGLLVANALDRKICLLTEPPVTLNPSGKLENLLLAIRPRMLLEMCTINGLPKWNVSRAPFPTEEGKPFGNMWLPFRAFVERPCFIYPSNLITVTPVYCDLSRYFETKIHPVTDNIGKF